MSKRILSLCMAILSCLPAFSQTNSLELLLVAESPDTNSTGSKVRLKSGEPLVISLTLASAMPFTRADLLFDYPDSLQDDPGLLARLDSIFAPVPVSGNGSPWYENLIIRFVSEKQKVSDLRLHLIQPEAPKVRELIPGEPLIAYFGLDPENTQQMKDGKWNLRIGLVPPGFDTIWSNKLDILINGSSHKQIKSLSKDELELFASYWLRRSICNKAEPYAEMLMQLDSISYRYYILKGEVAECLGDSVQALLFYRRALLIYRSVATTITEPPELLMMRIQTLQMKLLGIEEQ
jgi:hypothetical protein